MTTTDNSVPQTGVSRRRLIGAAGLTAVGIATASAATTARAEGGDPNNDAMGNPIEGEDSFTASAIPAVTAGYSYITGSQFDFHSNGSAPRVISGDGAYSATNYVVAPLHIAAGTRLREFTVWGRSTGVISTVTLRGWALDGTDSGIVIAAVTMPSGTVTTTPITVVCDHTTEAGRSYDVELLTSTSNQRILSFRIGAEPAGAFVPIIPYRAYDSRKPGVPSPGVLARLASRQVLVVNAINDAGAIAVANVIPSTARAVTYNLTATGTTGDNYLSIAPGAAASTTVSSINFAANQTIANAATVSLDSGTVKVFCGDGTGSSHFIIDITGYYI